MLELIALTVMEFLKSYPVFFVTGERALKLRNKIKIIEVSSDYAVPLLIIFSYVSLNSHKKLFTHLYIFHRKVTVRIKL